jgi:hypothetical protein
MAIGMINTAELETESMETSMRKRMNTSQLIMTMLEDNSRVRVMAGIELFETEKTITLDNTVESYIRTQIKSDH